MRHQFQLSISADLLFTAASGARHSNFECLHTVFRDYLQYLNTDFTEEVNRERVALLLIHTTSSVVLIKCKVC